MMQQVNRNSITNKLHENVFNLKLKAYFLCPGLAKGEYAVTMMPWVLQNSMSFS